MALYVLSDTHLSFGVDKPMDIFGARWKDYTRKLEDGWRRTVSDTDTVVIPGDISWAMTLSEAREDLLFLDVLPGRKIIGRGNHDYWWNSAAKMNAFLAENGIGTVEILNNNGFYREGFVICGSRGWFNDEKTAPKDSDYAKIIAREVIRLEMSIQSGIAEREKEGGAGEILCFLHFPPVFRDYICGELVAVLHKYGVRRCYYGHIHGVYDLPQFFTFEGITFSLVSADYLDFYPARIPNHE